MPKFERKTKEERMNEICEASKKVFLKKGFRNTTMEDVIAATTLSKGGVYQYYKSTKRILFDIMQNGNYFRYERSEEIIKKLNQKENYAETITQLFIAKIFDKVPEKKLYLMFLSEILYDKEYETLFFKLEKQSLEFFIKNLHILPEKEEEILKFINEEAIFLFRIFNGILIMNELFNSKDIFQKEKQKIHDIIFYLIQDSLKKYNEQKQRKNQLSVKKS